jgi:hypothetical protein
MQTNQLQIGGTLTKIGTHTLPRRRTSLFFVVVPIQNNRQNIKELSEPCEHCAKDLPSQNGCSGTPLASCISTFLIEDLAESVFYVLARKFPATSPISRFLKPLRITVTISISRLVNVAILCEERLALTVFWSDALVVWLLSIRQLLVKFPFAPEPELRLA